LTSLIITAQQTIYTERCRQPAIVYSKRCHYAPAYNFANFRQIFKILLPTYSAANL